VIATDSTNLSTESDQAHDEHIVIANGLSSCACSHKRSIYSTDALRIHERFHDFGTNGEAFGEVMQVWEPTHADSRSRLGIHRSGMLA
jgi:hypothetical protein